MSLLVEMGTFSLSNSHSRISVEASTSVEVRGCELESLPPHAEPLKHLRECSAWIYCNGSFQCQLQVSLDKHCAEYVSFDLSMLHIIAQTLVKADLWMQLYLNATLVDVSYSPRDQSSSNSYSSIILKLARSTVENRQCTIRHHHLPMPAAMSDVKPPAGVPTYHVQAVTTSLKIKWSTDLQPSSVTRKSKTRSNPVQDAKSSENSSCASQMNPQDSAYSEETWQAFAASQSKAFTDDELLAIIDAVLRLSICSDRPHLKHGIKILSDNRSVSLAQLAPAVWSPGYLLEIAERACLLPTTSQAFAHFMSAKTVSDALRSKLLLLLRQDDPRISFDELESAEMSSAKSRDMSAAHAKLWAALQKGKFGESASRVLKPLARAESTTNVSTAEDEMLCDERLEGVVGHELLESEQFLTDSSPILSSHSTSSYSTFENDLIMIDNEDNVDTSSLLQEDIWQDDQFFSSPLINEDSMFLSDSSGVLSEPDENLFDFNSDQSLQSQTTEYSFAELQQIENDGSSLILGGSNEDQDC